MNIERLKTKLKNTITETWQDHKPWCLSAIAAGVLGSSAIGLAYLDYLDEKAKLSTENVIQEISFPTKNVHYSILENVDYNENKMELFISLTSKESHLAYNQVTKYADSNDLDFELYHLSQNEDWELAARTFHTLLALEKNINLDKYFRLFRNKKDDAEIKKTIIPLLIEDNIDPTTFALELKSIEVIRSVNKDLKHSEDRDIEFIPTIIMHGNRKAYFGLFESYTDSMRLFSATRDAQNNRTPNKNTP